MATTPEQMEEIDKRMLEGELNVEQIQEQEKDPDPLNAELNQEALEVSEQAAAEGPEQKPEEGTGTETPAAAAEEEKPAEGQQDAKVDGAFANMRRENATLRAQIEAGKVAPQQQVAPAAPPEKSPRQVYLAENPDAEYFPPSVEVAQDEWKAQQSAKAVETTRQSTALDTVTKSLNDSYAAITNETHGVGLAELTGLAGHLLTPNDNSLIYQSGAEAGEQMHSILTRRAKAAGIYPQASKTVVTKPTGVGKTPAAQKQEQEQTQSEGPELASHVAQITNDVFKR